MVIASLVIAAVGGFGCARTVTQVVTYGDQMVVEVTLRGTMDVYANSYFLVIGTGEAFKVPLPPPANPGYEFLEPGTTPLSQTPTMADYFTNYYYSWAGYVIVDTGGYNLVDGPFVINQTQPNSRESLASLGTISNKIKFNFRLSQIYGSNIPDTIYFDFVTVKWPAGAMKTAADHLNSTNAYISKTAGSSLTVIDEEDQTVDAALDIEDCKVTIQ
ncbi:MAG TPA: hypothetical protein VMT55_06105 [Candidatus Sulfotelmatobacter sp.]|nr:hypothetical protein [Candidatus Sulfotelmatobacter sp.]